MSVPVGASLRRRKSLGQHFLRNKSLASRIVDALGALDEANVLEIGAGSGALTNELAARAAHLTAIEIDSELAASLQRKFDACSSVEVKTEDVLQFDILSWASAGRPLRPVVVGNIPYRITNSLLHRLMEFHSQLELVVLMLQEEVARKLTTPAGKKPYGMLSVLASYYAEVEYMFFVSRDNFHPRPRVDSALVKIDFARPYKRRALDEGLFQRLVRRLFADRRKQVQKILRKDPRFALSAEDLAALARDTELDLSCRPENLSVGQLVELADALAALKGTFRMK
ncbi:MAG: ribosomal RNA small subunit methyltransferase A [Deltaproteobacteria bacterium]|nr:MAG: ribosomal RNA small subunit methyltransferase A [Deltaproteobacteria bacterium]